MTDYTELVKALRCRATHDWTNCGNCKYADEDDDPRGCWGTEICADAADAIEALQADNAAIQGELDALRVFTDEAQGHIEELQAQLPKRGEWIDYENSHCECSVCHMWFNYFDNCTELFNFCPNCGAKMEVQDEGT